MKKASTKRSALCFCVQLAIHGPLSERDVQDHHQAEAYGEEDGRPVGVLAFCHAGDEVFDDDVDHGAGGETQEVRQDGGGLCREKDGQNAGERLNGAGERAVEERLAFGTAGRAKGHRDDGAFREVLDGDTDRQRECRGERDAHVAAGPAGQDDTDGHAFGEVVERDGEDQHDGLREAAFFDAVPHVLGVREVRVQVGDDLVEEQQEQDAGPEADGGGHEGPGAFARGVFEGRDEQGPD